MLFSTFAPDPWITLTVFIIAGISGGFVGYLMNNLSVKWRKAEFAKSLVFGTLVSMAGLVLLTALYSELFIASRQHFLNLVLAGCLCFMFSVVSLMFGYRFLMRMTLIRKKIG